MKSQENKKLIISLEEKNKDLEEINCELKSQIKENFKKANTLMQNKKDYPFERMLFGKMALIN